MEDCYDSYINTTTVFWNSASKYEWVVDKKTGRAVIFRNPPMGILKNKMEAPGHYNVLCLGFRLKSQLF